jgi:hypothetical protein
MWLRSSCSAVRRLLSGWYGSGTAPAALRPCRLCAVFGLGVPMRRPGRGPARLGRRSRRPGCCTSWAGGTLSTTQRRRRRGQRWRLAENLGSDCVEACDAMHPAWRGAVSRPVGAGWISRA